MSKLNRITGKVFGATADPTDDPTLGPEIGQFGSALAGTYNGTSDVETIQSLPAWSNGFIGAVTPTNQFPPLPEMTGFGKVLSHQYCYLLQQGVPEWDRATTYYTNGFCSYNGTIYKSMQDDNTNKQPDVETAYWIVYGAINDYANQDLSNLTSFGNARLQYAPFAINNGSVTNGENTTLRLPEGSQTEAWVTGTVDGYNGAAATITRTFDTPKTIKDITATYQTRPYISYRVYVTLTAILNDDSQVQIGSYNNAGSSTYTYPNVKYTFTSPVVVKALMITVIAPSGTYGGVFDISFTEQISISTSSTIICDPCIITTCDGRTKDFLGSVIYDTSETADGDYLIFKNYEDETLSLIPDFNISKTAPLANIATAANGISTTVVEGSLSNAFDGSAVAGVFCELFNGGASVSGVCYIGQQNLTKKIKKIVFSQGGWGSAGTNTNLGVSSVKIQVSADGSTWTDVQTAALNNGTAAKTTCYTTDITVNDYELPADTYQMRVLANSGVVHGNNAGWFINEVEFYADDDTANYLDISTVPANLYINGTLSNDLVYIGDCTVSSGVVSALSNKQFNMNGYWELFNLPDYDNKVSLVSGTSHTAELNGWILNGNTVVQPLYKGNSYTPSASGYYFARMRGF